MQEVPISLYLRLEQGERADLQVVSRSAIAFAKLVEEMAYLLDPSVTVRVQVVDANDQSFGLNTITKVLKNLRENVLTAVAAGAQKNPKIAWLAAYVALRIIGNGVDWTQDKIMDWLAGADAPAEVRALTPEERQELANDIAEKLKGGAAKAQTNELFEEIERDTKIDGVGVTSVPGKRPASIVPRSEFPPSGVTATDGEKRITKHQMKATLVSPVLVPGERRWKFRGAAGEFGASMRDRAFMDSVLTGALNIRLKAGLIMDIEVEISEVWDDRVWVVESRAVTDVRDWHDGPEQIDLLGSPPGDVEPD